MLTAKSWLWPEPWVAQLPMYAMPPLTVTADSVGEAVNLAVETAQSAGFVCVTGSLFLVGETLEWAGKPGF